MAVASHPFGMTFWDVFSEKIPTLALLSLGASEAVVGLQSGLPHFMQVLQLPTLRWIGRVSKRRILLLGQLVALAGGAPLLFFSSLALQEESLAIAVVLASIAMVAAGLRVGNTAWFPILNGFMEPGRTGRFFGTIRSVWHGALILYYLGSQFWLGAHPGDFGPVFAGAWVCGVIRVGLIARLPERSERTGVAIRVRDAFGVLRERLDLRRYLSGVIWFGALRKASGTFAIVMLRREVGFSDAELILMTLAVFAGGFVSLYLWGRVADRLGPVPVFIVCSVGAGILLLPLLAIREPGPSAFALAIAVFFGRSVLSAGFGVADTKLLFHLAPSDAPARTLVIAGVTTAVISSLVPALVGIALGRLLVGASAPLEVYAGFFSLTALLQAGSFLPLLRFRSRPLY